MLLCEMSLNASFIVEDGRCHTAKRPILWVGVRLSRTYIAKELNEFSQQLFALGAERKAAVGDVASR